MIAGRIRSVLCATDLSEASDEALRQAATIAGAAGARLVVLDVVVPGPVPFADPPVTARVAVVDAADLARQARAELEAQAARVRLRTRASLEVVVASDSAHAEIVQKADSMRADLVVVGSHGRSAVARVLLGSVAEKVVRHAPCPVLVARRSPASKKIVAATDFSDAASVATRVAADETRRRSATLTVLHCLDLPSEVLMLGNPVVPLPADHPESRPRLRKSAEARLAATLREAMIEAVPVVADGHPASSIVHLAEQIEAELVVVGTTGKSGLARALLGSVADAVTRKAPCSVLVVRESSQALTDSLVEAPEGDARGASSSESTMVVSGKSTR